MPEIWKFDFYFIFQNFEFWWKLQFSSNSENLKKFIFQNLKFTWFNLNLYTDFQISSIINSKNKFLTTNHHFEILKVPFWRKISLIITLKKHPWCQILINQQLYDYHFDVKSYYQSTMCQFSFRPLKFLLKNKNLHHIKTRQVYNGPRVVKFIST